MELSLFAAYFTGKARPVKSLLKLYAPCYSNYTG